MCFRYRLNKYQCMYHSCLGRHTEEFLPLMVRGRNVQGSWPSPVHQEPSRWQPGPSVGGRREEVVVSWRLDPSTVPAWLQGLAVAVPEDLYWRELAVEAASAAGHSAPSASGQEGLRCLLASRHLRLVSRCPASHRAIETWQQSHPVNITIQ